MSEVENIIFQNSKSQKWNARFDLRADNLEQTNNKIKSYIAEGYRVFGIKMKKTLIDLSSLAQLLEGIDLEKVELNFNCCLSVVVKFASVLSSYYQSSKFDLSLCHGSLEVDTFKKQLVRGISNPMWLSMSKKVLDNLVALPNFKTFNVNSVNFNNAGAYSAEELACAVAWAKQIVTSLAENTDYSVADLVARIQFTMGVGENYQMDIVKLIHLRKLWREEVEALDTSLKLEEEDIKVHSITSLWNKLIYNTKINLINARREAKSAILGGTNTLTVLPYDVIYRPASVEAMEEVKKLYQDLSELSAETKPKALPYLGLILNEAELPSYYTVIEEEARAVLRTIAENGGFIELIEKGLLQKSINRSNELSCEEVETFEVIAPGVNALINPEEEVLSEIMFDFDAVHSCGCGKPTLEPLTTQRMAQHFEFLRLRREKSGRKLTALVLKYEEHILSAGAIKTKLTTGGFIYQDSIIENLTDGLALVEELNPDVVVFIPKNDEGLSEDLNTLQKFLATRSIFVLASEHNQELCESLELKYVLSNSVNVYQMMKEWYDVLGVC